MERREFGILTVLHLAFLTWYYRFSVYILAFLVGSEDFLMHNMGFNIVTALALTLSAFLGRKMKATYTLYSWSILASLGTVLIFFAPNSFCGLLLYYMLGGLFGVAQLVFYRFFWSLTTIEERGRVSGLLGLVTLAFFPFATALTGGLGFSGTAALCIVFSLGVLAIRLFGPKEMQTPMPRDHAREANPERRSILLYLVPWVIYSLVNATFQNTISFNTLQGFSQSAKMSLIFLQLIGGCFGAIAGGIAADFLGRKVALALGLTLYGFSTALSGAVGMYEVVLFAHIVSGLNWGIFLTMYQLVIWGDLANVNNYAKLYSLGLTVFYLCTGIGHAFEPIVLQFPLAVASLISCLLIFLSNIPVILAPELLPSGFREKMRLKLYVYLLRKKPLRIMDRSR
ncbi:MAG: hypothetical protein OEZ24_04440 [Candidatus Bathyarchaeota archaeon]|nr:hypothetical protein [Candidatus Bathyarchaeota archaeon]